MRLAQPSDLPQLMVMIRRVVPAMMASGNTQWNDTYPNETVFLQDIEARDLWVAEAAQGGVVGVAAFTTAPGHEYVGVGWDVNEPAVFTHRLAVDPDHRGHGVAFALMQQAEQVARDLNIFTLRVDTGIKNLPAQRLIKRCGYRFVAEIPLPIRPGLRVLCYEKRLSSSHESRPHDPRASQP